MRRRPAIRLICALVFGATLAVAALAANRAPQTVGGARLIGVFHWEEPANWFGGFSGLELAEDGASMVVLGDRATLLRAGIQRHNGEISGVDITSTHRLRSSRGTYLSDRIVDSEGLAIGADGTLYISFEGISRVAHYQTGADRARVLPRPKAFRKLPWNKALEALAIDRHGWLYTLPERALDADGNIPVWRWDGENWQTAFALPSRNGYYPVGADFGPDGRFYLLERDLSLFGFRSRLRRWEISPFSAESEQVLFESGAGEHDNLEGLSIWRDPSGELRATMVSDDNFRSIQKTELVEYHLPD